MAETTASRLADYILAICARRQIQVTNLKLQKLLYYSQAWYLALADVPLFSERIEAWVHGPAVPPIFGKFKHLRWKAIPIDFAEVSIETGDTGRPIESHVREVLEAYGGLTGAQLETLTHREDPWREARNGIPPDQPSHAVISHESMKAYYRAELSQAQ